ncbi:DUF421 domain-containing protein [Sphingomonas gilva]|uniref:DUF421 domain-containing protein n=1 Tax=Sphingomonas gilva TaxID=2305907 RepID=A0A396RMS8_9SPHN|nr:YetF domain-containing protein [Sphingomonas gilva]RHW16452.1 DUF421 domain-containing protein [Sphingomonas gilva]
MDIVLRATFMFLVVFALLRLLGKRELAQMTPFELVSLIVIGDLIQQGITHNDFSVTGATLAIATFAFWSVLLGWITYRWPRVRDALEGTPRVIIRHGELLRDNLRGSRITPGEVESEMRLAGIARMDDVAWAIVEPQGKISFIGRGKDEGGQPPAEDTQAG